MAVLVLLDNGLRTFQVPTYRCVRQLKSAKVTASINMLSNYFEIIPENCHKRYVKNIKKNKWLGSSFHRTKTRWGRPRIATQQNSGRHKLGPMTRMADNQ